jgi:hypothetical protein
MRRMMLLAAVMLASAAAALPASPQVTDIDLSKHPGGQTVRRDGATVTMRPRAAGQGLVKAVSTIRVPGYPPIAVSEDVAAEANVPRSVGIGRLARTDRAPSVLLVGYTGGAHCCVTLKAVVPRGGRLRAVKFPDFDGALDRFPEDVDGDGVVDVLIPDNRFLYAFGSYAGSMAPPQFFNIVGTRIVEVSDRAGFRPRFASFMAKARARCADRSNDDRNGACAGYVAAAARLGRYAPALREASAMASTGTTAWLPDGCSVPTGPSGCPKGHEIKFHNFSAALGWFLKNAGYIR